MLKPAGAPTASKKEGALGGARDPTSGAPLAQRCNRRSAPVPFPGPARAWPVEFPPGRSPGAASPRHPAGACRQEMGPYTPRVSWCGNRPSTRLTGVDAGLKMDTNRAHRERAPPRPPPPGLPPRPPSGPGLGLASVPARLGQQAAKPAFGQRAPHLGARSREPSGGPPKFAFQALDWRWDKPDRHYNAGWPAKRPGVNASFPPSATSTKELKVSPAPMNRLSA